MFLMKKSLSIITILLLFYTINFAQTYKQVKIYLNSPSDVRELMKTGFEFDHPFYTKDKAIIVFINERDYNRLIHSGYNFEVLIDNWKEYYNNRPKLSEQAKQLQLSKIKSGYNVTGFGFGSMGGYYTLAEVNAQLDSMKLHFPNLITTKTSIGQTIQNRPIYMVKISDNPDVDEDEPEVLYTALHHAREPESIMQMIFFMYYLLENYGTDAEATYLVNNRELYFIPVVNPDGYEYNHQTDPNGGGFWRKNRRDNGSGNYGIDLNRNYGPYEYWNAPNGGSDTDPSSETYRGTAPFSEPETAAIKDFIATKHFRNVLNYHTYSNLLIYPYGALERETPDSLAFREFARDMTAYNGYEYGLDQETVGYSTRGNSDDFMYDGDTISNGGKIFAMTPEVGSDLDGFWPPEDRIIPLAQENLFPNLYYAWVAGAYVGLENVNFDRRYFNPGDVVHVSPVLKNKGLSDASGIRVELNSLSTLTTATDGTADVGFIQSRDTAEVSSPLSFSISSNALADDEVKLEFVTFSNETVMSRDTVKLIIGTPAFIFTDSTNDLSNLWTVTATPSNPQWEATTTSYYSSPMSYTDSKDGNYTDNATVTMTLKNPVDLSAYQFPKLVFWSKWDIESNWDYGQVEVTTNNGATWIPLQGKFTEPGVGFFQPNGEPVYDGMQPDWVLEEISLANYNTSQVKIRYRLKSDESITKDGWYVDDIGIVYYTIVPVELTSFTATSGNLNVVLKWSTATELNNHGFDVQRADGKGNNLSWITVGFVEGRGTSTLKNDYSFVDNNPLTGKSYYRLKQIDYNGSYKIYDAVSTEFTGVTEYALEQNYPNPFNPSTKIEYAIPEASYVTLTVYNLLGSEVCKLVDENQEAGKHSVQFSTDKLDRKIGSGIYLYTLKAGVYTSTRKMVVLK